MALVHAHMRPHVCIACRLLMETLRISMLGTNRQPLEELIAEAAAAYNASQSCRTAVHSVDQVGGPHAHTCAAPSMLP
jgi:hypothetical protein